MISITISTIFLALALCVRTAHGSLASSINALPSCATECLFTAISASPCGLTNQTCMCTDMQLQSNVEVCVLQACTIKEGLVTKNVTSTACNAPIRDRSGIYSTLSTTMIVLSSSFVLMRLVYKIVLTISEIGLDDWFILITLLTGVLSSVINVRGMALNGLGRDIWTLRFEQVTAFVRWLYIMEVLYFAQVALLKLSLLFFYYRIFPGRPVRRVLIATMVFNCLFGAIFVLAAIFQCQPMSYYWKSWDGEHTGKCLNLNALCWSNAAISIALDIWMLAIPLFQLARLKMGFKQKVGVAMMFFVGTFVTVVSILRLQYLVYFANSANPTWDQWSVCHWSTIEINVGIMCTCMPAMRVILMRFLPSIMGSTRNASAAYNAKYGSNSRRGVPLQGSNNAATGRGEDREDQLGGSRTITFTKTVEVRCHEDSLNDEESLVRMNELSKDGGRAGAYSRNDSF